MTRLSVNINKIATLRNARGGNIPDVVQAAINCEKFGAEGITIHPRPDERHIRYTDVLALKRVVKTPFNIEGYPNKRFIEIIKEVKPDQATLVPDPPGVLTSNAGWDTKKHSSFLKDIIAEIKLYSANVSIFVDTDLKNIENAPETGTDSIELYTGPYAETFDKNKSKAVVPYVKAAKMAINLGLGINAGHDLNLDNLGFFKTQIHGLDEVSIGHALIADALYLGLENTIQLYKRLLKEHK